MQKLAIIAAHNVGEGELGDDGGPARLDHYTDSQLRRKARILQEAGIDAEGRRNLIEAGIVGERYITVYHGSLTKEDAENLKMWGPSQTRKFFVTSSLTIAKNAAGPNGEVLVYHVSESEAESILGKEEPYMGMFSEAGGTQYVIEGDRAKKLHEHLDHKQKKCPY